MKENKKKIIILICIIVITIVFAIINLLMNKKDNADILKVSVETIGKKYYTEYLYQNYNSQVVDAANDEVSIMVSLDKLFSTTKFGDEYKFEDTKLYKECDLINSVIIYTPHKPIEKDNFDIEVILNCDNK